MYIKISLLGILSIIDFSSCSKKIDNNDQKTNPLNKVSSDKKIEYNLVNIEKCSSIAIESKLSDKNMELKNVNDKLLKKSLCNHIINVLNKGEKPINAYSNMWGANIQFVTQDSFTQIMSDGNFIPNLAIKEWISRDGNMGSLAKKKFAFGEVNNSIDAGDEIDFKIGSNLEKKKWGIWDIHFIDENGKILKANSQSGKTAEYVEEFSLNPEYIKNIFGVFTISKNEKPSQIYFLKKDGKYDIKEYNDSLKIYKDIENDGELFNLFPMIPKDDLFSINYVQKLSDNKIALFKKSGESQHYSGYYLITFDDIKNYETKVTFVSVENIIEKNCNKKDDDVVINSVCKLLQDKKFIISGSGVNYNDSSAVINDYQGSKYYYISQDGILSEKQDFEFEGVNSDDILMQISNKKEKVIWFISKDGKKYTRYPDSINNLSLKNKEINENNWNGRYFYNLSINSNLNNSILNFPMSIDNLSENIIIFNDGKYVNYNSDGNGKVVSSGYTNRIFPYINSEEIKKISASFNIKGKIYLLKNDKTGFYIMDTNKNNETIFVNNVVK